MKKKIILSVIAVFICVITVFCIYNASERRTLRLYEGYRDELEAEIKSGSSSGRPGLKCSYYEGENFVIEYTVSAFGIAPSTKYYGFFYSDGGEPIAFQNAQLPLEKVSENEWRWDGEGDNHGIVRALDGNWFYFEASF